MSSLISDNQASKLHPASLATLEDCTEESVYAPGFIQPHGILLKLQAPHLTILQVSENVEQFFGIPAADLLGRSLRQLFSHTQVKQIVNFLQQDSLDFCNPFELKTRREITQTNQPQKPWTFRSTLHQTANALILELEPLLTINGNHIAQTYHQLQVVIRKLRRANSLLDLAQVLAREFKMMTGFDRVMIYRFEPDDHGVVIAEEKETHLESYLGLHFPAIDIPVPARKLFLRNWVRQIPDVNYSPAQLISAEAFAEEPSLDLSDCVLRGVSPYHIEYLQNMGVAGSLTISLIDDHHLWGLIACHHYSSKQVNYETRKTCEFLGQFASIELVHQQEHELSSYQTQVKAIQDKLQQAFLQNPNFIQQVLAQNAVELLHLVHAEGIAIALDHQISLTGQTPSLEAVQSLLAWLSQLDQPEFYLTDCLVQNYPSAGAFKEVASGILAISIVLHQRSYHLVWFRPEQVQTVNWAGNPQDAVTIDELGNKSLCPRKSFELWKQTVQETSLPWQASEIEAARMMRNTLMLAVLEFSQIALEQAAERAAIANRAKSQFLAKMSHELRTPLNAILGFAQVMNRSPNIPAEFQEPVSIINRSGEHLLALINDVLEMSRIEAGQIVLREHHFNLHRLLRSLQEMFALKAAQKGLSLIFEEDPDVPRYICSDEAKLRQILINLISNAIKFTTQGGVLVRVSAAATQATERNCACYPNAMPPCHPLKLSFMIKDTGCGINHGDWDAIFEAFIQTERGHHAEGTGLGLCISRQFARLLGGDITVQSMINQGATFTCQITIYQPEAVDLLDVATGRLVIGLEPNQRTYRILVAEDTPENCQLLLTLLGSIGFEVKTVETGVEAIAQWRAWQPDLILMDVQMLEMDGLEATRQIRLQESGEQRPPTPIIMLTANAFEVDRQASLQAGCNEHIAKPFNETVLLEAIAHFLGVCYRYSDKPNEISSFARSVTPTDLKVMSREWMTQVHEAALDLNEERLYQLVNQIPGSKQGLTEAMTQLINTLQFETIATLTQSQEEPS